MRTAQNHPGERMSEAFPPYRMFDMARLHGYRYGQNTWEWHVIFLFSVSDGTGPPWKALYYMTGFVQ